MKTVFTDESNITQTDVYGIGGLALSDSIVELFNKYFYAKHQEYGLTGEVKWTKVSTGGNLINFALDIFYRVLTSKDAHLSILVVNKAKFRKWRANQEEAFYTSYTMLLKHLTEALGTQVRVYMDDKQDSYDKQDEVVNIVTNHMLAKIGSRARISKVSKDDSKLQAGLQTVDLLVGPVVAAHALYLNPNLKIHAGKKLLIRQMAQVLGWDDLWYDTYPRTMACDGFNVWHFPIETRAQPGSQDVTIAKPCFIAREQLEARKE